MADEKQVEKQRSFKVDTEDLKVNVSGSPEKVSQIYQALQGVLNTIIPNTLTDGGDLLFTTTGTKDEPKS